MSRRVRLKIRYERQADLVVLLTLAVLVVALLGYLALAQREAAASTRPAPLAVVSGLRQYYLTTSGYNGANADTACASGYHMASLWEILDPSHLKYNTSLGQVTADSGQGPPSWPFWGWVRTGYSSNNSTTPGYANCNAWSTTSGKGTYAGLTDNWTGGLQDVHVWNVDTATWDCSAAFRVWCVASEETIAGLAATNDSPTPLGQATTLTATITGGTNVTYTWAFGHAGATGSGAVVTHTYPAASVYTAVVTASNSVSSLTATTTVTITGASPKNIYLPIILCSSN